MRIYLFYLNIITKSWFKKFMIISFLVNFYIMTFFLGRIYTRCASMRDNISAIDASDGGNF